MRALTLPGPAPSSPPHAAALSANSAAPARILRMAVAPTDEAERLGELLRERRELGGTMGEILNGAELFRCCRGHCFGLLAGCLRGGARLAERFGDPGRETGALPPDFGHLLACAGGFRGRIGDAVQVLYPLG